MNTPRHKDINSLIQQLSTLKNNLYGNDFLLTWDKTQEELKAVMLAAEILQALHWQGKSIFRDNSTRTRFSFASAASALGLTLSDLDEVKSQIAHGETVRETANMISFLTEVIGIRDDMYPGEGHTYMLEVAEAVEQGFKEGLLPSRPALVNLQCDLDHPTQSLADLLKLKDYFGAMSWAYSPSYGKPLSVPQGVINLMTRFGMEVVLAHPKGYDLLPETIISAHDFAAKSGGSFRMTNDMQDAFKNADIVYPKSWAPMVVMQERTKLLHNGDKTGLVELEKACLAQNAEHTDWECNESMMKLTRGGSALYEHCLPADITDVSCKQGEVAQSVFEKYRYHTYQEAGFKPFVIAAMIFMSKVANPVQKLTGFNI
jgi:knotted carbamoyltransferase YgeW